MHKKQLGRVMLPYKLERQSDGRYAVVNRDYKPIGHVDTGEWVDYGPYALRLRGVTETVASKVCPQGSTDTEHIYLFHDGCPPWESDEFLRRYIERLKRLFRLKIG